MMKIIIYLCKTYFIGNNGSTISCCGSVGNTTHPECFPVIVQGDGDRKCGKCMEFVRSSPASTCNFGDSFFDFNTIFNLRKNNLLRFWFLDRAIC